MGETRICWQSIKVEEEKSSEDGQDYLWDDVPFQLEGGYQVRDGFGMDEAGLDFAFVGEDHESCSFWEDHYLTFMEYPSFDFHEVLLCKLFEDEPLDFMPSLSAGEADWEDHFNWDLCKVNLTNYRLTWDVSDVPVTVRCEEKHGERRKFLFDNGYMVVQLVGPWALLLIRTTLINLSLHYLGQGMGCRPPPKPPWIKGYFLRTTPAMNIYDIFILPRFSKYFP